MQLLRAHGKGRQAMLHTKQYSSRTPPYFELLTNDWHRLDPFRTHPKMTNELPFA